MSTTGEPTENPVFGPVPTAPAECVLSPSGYDTAADIYWRRGWESPLPVPRAAKHPPPTGYTGRNARVPSYPDLCTWGEQYPNGNLALRLPDGIMGIDVDAYGGKGGGQTLAEAEMRLGPLPLSYVSTSRDDGVSGIRLYRVPKGIQLSDGIAFPERGVGGIDIIQPHHRYVVAWPSIHPSGAPYQWINQTDGTAMDQPPAVDDLPHLPPRWLKHLAAKTISVESNSRVRDLPNLTDALTGGTPSPKVLARLTAALNDLTTARSRHDATRGHVLALLRLGNGGESGVKAALTMLGDAFVDAVTNESSTDRRSHDEAAREWRRMVYRDRVVQLLAEPGHRDVSSDVLDDNGYVAAGDSTDTAGLAYLQNVPANVIHAAHLGMANKLGAQFKGQLLYVNGIGWFRWDGKRYVRDGNGAARRAVHAVIGRERAKADRLPTEEREKRTRLWRSREKSRPCGMSFDPQFARDTVLPLVQAAYQVFHNPDVDPTLPAGYQKTALLEADPTLLDLITELSESARSFVQTVAGVTTVFGLVGKNTATKTAFVAIRGTQTQTEWLQNLDVESTVYRPVSDFGDVHMGWMGLYETMRANLAANLPAACAGCDQLIVTGHSLGAALAVLAAPDIAKNISVVPEPKLTTFGGPRPGLHDFVVPFNLLIDSCFRVVNLFDIVPHLPLALPGLPYEHVGVQIAVDSGGSIDQTHRHFACVDHASRRHQRNATACGALVSFGASRCNLP